MNRTRKTKMMASWVLWFVGCGAVSTTFMTGALIICFGLTKPVGSNDSVRQDSWWARAADKKYLVIKRYRSLLTSTISYSAPGMSILRMPIRLPCMPRF